MTYTSEESRWKIIHEWKLGKSIYKAASECNVSFKVAKRWINRYNATGNVNIAAKSGRRSLLNIEAQEKAFKLLIEDKLGAAAQVSKELFLKGFIKSLVHKTTIIRAAKKVARKRGTSIKAVRGKPQVQLSKQTIQKRQSFCACNIRRSWKNIMFTDRKRFMFCHPGVKVSKVTWIKKGETRKAYTVSHAQSVNVYAGITMFGVTKLHVVAGTSCHKSDFFNKKGKPAKNITQNEYKEVLLKTLLPEGQRIFRSNNIATWTFQQDNDPAHVVAQSVIKIFNNAHSSNISLLKSWPPSSPDLSPIENLWGIMQSKIEAKGCKNFAEFKDALHDEWKSASKHVLRSLLNSVNKRLASCLKLGGDRTKY